MHVHLIREWNYLGWTFYLGLAVFDKIGDGPINVVLDSLAGPISQSAKCNHHFLVEPACGKTRKPQLFNVIRPLSGGCVHDAFLRSFRAARKQILLSSPSRNSSGTRKNFGAAAPQTALYRIATAPSRFNDLTIDFAPPFLSLSRLMRLLVEILIVAAVIFLGWNTPFKERADRAKATITSTLDSMGGTLQKHHDKDVRRY